ncbi:MFS transporter [Labrys portucalensis]|uniref:MFS transporter n=2 Tax=Labrys neptuniae TaxID=376174 RepID=A0ABV6ZQC9_9HYPH
MTMNNGQAHLAGRDRSDRASLDRAISRAKWRILPFLILMYLLAYLDRVNIGFAKQSYQATTGVTEAAFAFGAGVFFLTYALFELPSNLMLHKVGARRWLARIMVTWGIISGLMMFAYNDTTFSLIRVVLGAAEAGLFPGAILYLTLWFPKEVRGKILAIFYFGSPLALIFGGPISGLFLDMDGLFGLHGWQLMFLIEGGITVLVGIWAYFYLTDTPAEAKWMPADERQALTAALAAEQSEKAHSGEIDFARAVRNARLFYFAAIYFLIQITGLGVAFYLPTQVAALLGVKVGLLVGCISAIPWICALIAGFFYPDWAVRSGRRQICLLFSLAAIALGLVASAHASPALAIAALCFVTMGIMTAQPIFWTFPTQYLGGAAAAGGFAVINSLGALGGFVAPNVRTGAITWSGIEAYGLYAIAAAAFLAFVLVLFIKRVSDSQPLSATISSVQT